MQCINKNWTNKQHTHAVARRRSQVLVVHPCMKVGSEWLRSQSSRTPPHTQAKVHLFLLDPAGSGLLTGSVKNRWYIYRVRFQVGLCLLTRRVRRPSSAAHASAMSLQLCAWPWHFASKKVAVPAQTRLSGLGTKSNLDMSSRAPHCSKKGERNSIPSRTMCCIKTETNFEQNYLPFRESSERENHPA